VVALEPMRRSRAATQSAPATSKRGAALSSTRGRGAFTLQVRVRGVAPGTYRLVVTATSKNGSPLGRPLVRAVRVTR